MTQLAIMAGIAFVMTWLMSRQARQQSSKTRNPVAEVTAEMRQVENSARGIAADMEVRVYDFARDLEARMDTRLHMLDRLIQEADDELVKLQGLLSESRRDEPISAHANWAEVQQRAFALWEAGFDPEEIARCLGLLTAEVRDLLDEWRQDEPGQRAA